MSQQLRTYAISADVVGSDDFGIERTDRLNNSGHRVNIYTHSPSTMVTANIVKCDRIYGHRLTLFWQVTKNLFFLLLTLTKYSWLLMDKKLLAIQRMLESGPTTDPGPMNHV